MKHTAAAVLALSWFISRAQGQVAEGGVSRATPEYCSQVEPGCGCLVGYASSHKHILSGREVGVNRVFASTLVVLCRCSRNPFPEAAAIVSPGRTSVRRFGGGGKR